MNKAEEIINKIKTGPKTDEEWIKLHDEVENCELSLKETKKLMNSGYTETLAMIYDGIMYERQMQNQAP